MPIAVPMLQGGTDIVTNVTNWSARNSFHAKRDLSRNGSHVLEVGDVKMSPSVIVNLSRLFGG